jgi:Predicted nucleotide-binding protein containing TIR-like domain
MTLAEQAGADPRKVFVIHGRNEFARKGLFEFLRAIGLDPIEWEQAITMTGSGSPYIGQVLDAAFGAAQAVVVLQTPDDVAHLHDSLAQAGDPECEPQMQARPNVLFEAGMAMGRNEDRTIMVTLGQVREFSDFSGRHAIRMDGSVAKRNALATRLRTAGCTVNTDGSDWQTAGDLTPPARPGSGLPMGRRLPTSQSSGVPKLSARLSESGGNKVSKVTVTNLGPGDVFDLDVHPAEGEDVGLYRDSDDLPIARLPQGKSVTTLRVMSLHLGSRSRSHFNIVITGKTADGTPIEQTEFVSVS